MANSMGLFLWISVVSILLSNKGALCDEKKVFEEVIEAHHYNTKVRPLHNSSDAVDVEVEFELRQITNLDQQNQVLFFSGYIVAIWQDEYLTWDPSNYNGTTNMIIPPTSVWLPDIGIINSAESFYQSTFTTDFRVHVNHTGQMLWSFGGNFATTCQLDLTYFPFDRQMCSIVVENWAYNSEEVELNKLSSHIPIDDFHKNGEWDLQHTSVEKEYIPHDAFPGKQFPKLKFNMYLKRKAGYYGLNIMAPCFFIISVALGMFWLPADSGEKVGVGVTVLLAFSVFQLVIADGSPKTSDSFPILSMYVSFVMGMSTVSTTTAIICLYFHHHLANKPVPLIVKRIFFTYISRVLCMHDTVPDVTTPGAVTPIPLQENPQKSHSSLDTKETPPEESTGKVISSAEAEIIYQLQYVTNHLKQQENDESLEDDWKALARIIDRSFFFICLIVITSVCVFMFTQEQPQMH